MIFTRNVSGLGLALLATTLFLSSPSADGQTKPALTDKPPGNLTYAALRAEADRRIAEFANEHVHDQCKTQELAFATLRIQAEGAPNDTRPEWRLVLARSELEVEKCYRESMAGLAAFIGRRHLLERWGYPAEPTQP